MEITTINIDLIDPHPDNPRNGVTKGAVKDSGLAKNISENGILTPLIVRVNPDSGDGDVRYQVICGHRRRMGAIVNKLATVPCQVLEMDDAAALQLMVIENFQHAEMTPMEEANGVAMLKKSGMRLTQIAKKIGKAGEWVQTRLSFLDLPETAQKALARREANPSSLLQVLDLPAEKRDEAVQLILYPHIQSYPLQPGQVRDIFENQFHRPAREAAQWEAQRESALEDAREMYPWAVFTFLGLHDEQPKGLKGILATYQNTESADGKKNFRAVVALAERHQARLYIRPVKCDGEYAADICVEWPVILDAERALRDSGGEVWLAEVLGKKGKKERPEWQEGAEAMEREQASQESGGEEGSGNIEAPESGEEEGSGNIEAPESAGGFWITFEELARWERQLSQVRESLTIGELVKGLDELSGVIKGISEVIYED